MAAGLECRVSRLHEPQDSAEDELESTTVDLNEPILLSDPNSFLKTDSEIGGTPLIVALAPSAGLSLGPYSGIAMKMCEEAEGKNVPECNSVKC